MQKFCDPVVVGRSVCLWRVENIRFLFRFLLRRLKGSRDQATPPPPPPHRRRRRTTLTYFKAKNTWEEDRKNHQIESTFCCSCLPFYLTHTHTRTFAAFLAPCCREWYRLNIYVTCVRASGRQRVRENVLVFEAFFLMAHSLHTVWF